MSNTKGMKIKDREIDLGEDWFYFEIIKPTNKSLAQDYMRHMCKDGREQWTAPFAGSRRGTGWLRIYCIYCLESVPKEVLDKATTLLKMRML